MESQAIAYAEHVIARGAVDWQEVQDALSNNVEIAEWLGDDISAFQRIIRKAEARFGDQLPTGYSN